MAIPPAPQGAEPPPPIFISYRRADTLGHAVHLHDALMQRFDARSVFMDLHSIHPGGLWPFDCQLGSLTCQVMLVLIGRQWLTITDQFTGHRRLDDPDDVLRGEVARALARGILVVPVLFDGAPMPTKDDLPDDLKPLADRNAVRVNAENWVRDVTRLTAYLESEGCGQPRIAAQPAVVQGAHALPVVGPGSIVFAVSLSTRDALIIVGILVLLWLTFRPHGWWSAWTA